MGGCVVILHATAIALTFETIYALFGNQPLIDQDWGLHFHHLRSLEAYWRDSAGLSGYNPFFMAGYPSNTIQDLSIKFFEFAALGLSTIALAPVQWFKIVAFLATASIPALMFFAGRNFFDNHAARDMIAVGAALLGTVYWWNSLPREMFFYGMIGFPAAAYGSVWGVSLFYRLVMDSPKPGLLHLGWLLFAAVILSLHVQSLVIFMPSMIALLIVQARRITGALRIFGWSRRWRLAA